MRSEQAGYPQELASGECVLSGERDLPVMVYFEQSYAGSVHLILGSFVMDTVGSVNEALLVAEKYVKAAKRCNKKIELVPTDCTYQTVGRRYQDWITRDKSR